MLIDIRRATARILQRKFEHLNRIRYSLKDPDIVFVSYSRYDSDTLEMLKEKDPALEEKEEHLDTFNIMTEKWEGAEHLKKTFLEDSFPFRFYHYEYEFFNYKNWKKKKDAKQDVPLLASAFGHQQYQKLRNYLVNSQIIIPMVIDGRRDVRPILYWGENFLLCRSEGRLIIVNYAAESGSEITTKQVPVEIVEQDPRLLQPRVVACLYNRKNVELFVKQMIGKRRIKITKNMDTLSRPMQQINIFARLPLNLNSRQTVPIINSSDIILHNLHLEYRIQDQLGGGYPDGVFITFGNGADELLPGETTNLRFVLAGDEKAPKDGKLILLVKSDEELWGTVTIHFHFNK